MNSTSRFIASVLFSVAASVYAGTSSLNGVWSQPPQQYLRYENKSVVDGRVAVKAKFAVLKEYKYEAAAPRLFVSLGRELYRNGYFTDAIACFKLGFDTYKDSKDHDVKMFADICAGELAQMYARIGRVNDLKQFFSQNSHRGFLGQGSALMDQSYEALGEMINIPEISFKCGPYALQSILHKQKPKLGINKILNAAKSPTTGFSLADVKELSRKVGLNFNIYKMEPGATIYLPCVVHWKLNHFGAILDRKDDLFRVADPTFGHEMWITEDAIREEASGYVLLPEGSYPGYSEVDQVTAASVYGKGNTGGPDKNAGSDKDLMTCPAPMPTSIAMPTYRFQIMAAALRLEDTPLSYTPAYGPKMDFTLHYNQRDFYDPITMNVASFGHQWSFNWFGYVAPNPDSSDKMDLASSGGGGVTYSGGSDCNENESACTVDYAGSSFGNNTFTVISDPIAPSATEKSEDGTVREYTHKVPLAGTEYAMLLTKITDRFGHSVTINYDSHHRITSVVDATGGISTFCYNKESPAGNCLPLISSITDPYGRTAYFDYDSLHRLTSIRDVIGMTSTFSYELDGSFVELLSTPYGDTTFERESYDQSNNPSERYIEATDPEGHKERIQSYYDSGDIQSLFKENQYPDVALIPHGRSYLNWRNVAYWNKKAMEEAPGDVAAATIYHFLHTYENKTSRLPEKIKKPLEGPICYFYPGQEPYEDDIYYERSAFDEGLGSTGKDPSMVGRLLDTGETQVYQISYNTVGNVTETTDPIGRHQINTYAANGVDVTGKSIEINGTLTSVSLVQYDAHSHPLSMTDATGAETTATYDGVSGLPTAITNARHETTTYQYDMDYLLRKIINPDPLSYMDLSYDSYDRVSSVTKFPENYTMRYEYDIFDRKTKVIYPDGTSEKLVYDKLDVKAKRDRLGQWTKYDYNANRQCTAVTNSAGEQIQYSWCGCGALDALIDPEGRTTNYYYDIQSRLTSMTLPATNPKFYTYEEISGRLISITDPKGQTRHAAYNVDNTIRDFWVDNVAVGTEPVSPVHVDWDEDLKRVEAWGDSYGTTTLTYNLYQGIAALHIGAGKLSTWNGPSTNDTLTYGYDELGRVVNSSAGTITYDNLGRVTQIVNDLDTFIYAHKPHSSIVTGYSQSAGGSTAYSYKSVTDDLRLDSIVNKDGNLSTKSSFDYDYDDLGRIESMVQSNNGIYRQLDASYDNAGRLNQLHDEDVPEQVWDDFTWLFDKAGNRTNQQIATYGAGVKREAYTINSKDQVTATASGGAVHVSGYLNRAGTIASSYPLGNVPVNSTGHFATWIDTNSLTSATIHATDFSGNSTQKAVAIPVTAAPGRSFVYDDNGNMTQMSTTLAGGGAATTIYYTWDALDRLVGITNDYHDSYFDYDGLGRMVHLIEINMGSPEKELQFVWDGLKMISASGSVASSPVTKQYFDQGMIYNGDNYYYAKDHLGSIRALYDEDMLLVDTFDYDAYGNFAHGTSANSILDNYYTGRYYYHAESGLFITPFRTYNPAIGRWLSREPLGIDRPNLYHYVFNHPLNSIDMYGLWTLNIGGSASGGWGGGYGGLSDGIVIDGHGNVGVYGSGSAGGGVIVPAQAGITGNVGAGTYNSIFDFGGQSTVFGAAGGDGLFGSGEISASKTGTNFEAGLGTGVGGAAYVTPTYTVVCDITDYLPIDEVAKPIEWLLDWYY